MNGEMYAVVIKINFMVILLSGCDKLDVKEDLHCAEFGMNLGYNKLNS